MRRAFFDTNLLGYRLLEQDERKRSSVERLWESSIAAGTAVISTQVMSELAAILTRGPRTGVRWQVIHRELARLALLPVALLRPADLVSAAERCVRLQLPWYDALILQAAIVGGCDVLYSEDFQHGRTYDGVQVINPFLDVPGSPRPPVLRVRERPAVATPRAATRKKK